MATSDRSRQVVLRRHPPALDIPDLLPPDDPPVPLQPGMAQGRAVVEVASAQPEDAGQLPGHLFHQRVEGPAASHHTRRSLDPGEVAGLPAGVQVRPAARGGQFRYADAHQQQI
jgi:hypothetical protein